MVICHGIYLWYCDSWIGQTSNILWLENSVANWKKFPHWMCNVGNFDVPFYIYLKCPIVIHARIFVLFLFLFSRNNQSDWNYKKNIERVPIKKLGIWKINRWSYKDCWLNHVQSNWKLYLTGLTLVNESVTSFASPLVHDWTMCKPLFILKNWITSSSWPIKHSTMLPFSVILYVPLLTCCTLIRPQSKAQHNPCAKYTLPLC